GAPVAQLAGLDLHVLRVRVPGQDAARPVPRLARRRVQVDADPGGRGVQWRGLEGRGLRVPADRAAAVPVRVGALPDADARAVPDLDHVGHARRVYNDRLADGRRLLE